VNALLNHRWGESPAQDRVWAQVTGLAPGRAVRRLLMALQFQAFVDGSAQPPDGDIVLAGHIAPAEAWAHFAKEWEELLPRATLAKNGKYHFKMSEMAMRRDGIEKTEPFYRLIEKYAVVSISYRMSLEDFANAIERIQSPTGILASLGMSFALFRFENPFFFIFRCLMDDFHKKGREAIKHVIPLSETVDFIFDDQSEKSYILEGWDDFVSEMPEEERQYYGATPRFENDQDFLPLQAADLWAWWVREWYEEDAFHPPDKMLALDFRKWRGKDRFFYVYALTEDDIVGAFESMFVGQLALNEARGSIFRLAKPDASEE
jgi:hypothetical protein